MTWILRPAVDNDIEDLVGLISDSMSGVLEVLFGSTEGIRRRLAQPGMGPGLSGCVVAAEDGRVIAERLGYPLEPGAGWTLDPEPDAALSAVLQTFRILTAPGTWYLSSLAVRPGHRRQGIGRELLRSAAASALAAGHSEMSLHVFRAQTAAIALYSSVGFEERGSVNVPPHPRMAFASPLVLMVAPAEAIAR